MRMMNEEAIRQIQDNIDFRKRLQEGDKPQFFDAEENEKDIEAFEMAIKALSAEPCEDAISRQAARKIILDEFEGWPTDEEVAQLKRLTKQIDDLPSVTPKQRTGWWIMTGGCFKGYSCLSYFECSCCHKSSLEKGCFCPNCGAKMEGEQNG